jgi:hypothetical protein
MSTGLNGTSDCINCVHRSDATLEALLIGFRKHALDMDRAAWAASTLHLQGPPDPVRSLEIS